MDQTPKGDEVQEAARHFAEADAAYQAALDSARLYSMQEIQLLKSQRDVAQARALALEDRAKRT